MRPRPTHARSARRGFTLIDVAVVLVILALSTVLVVPQWQRVIGPGSADAASDQVIAHRLVGLLEEARRQAIERRHLVQVYVDPAARLVRIDTGGSGGSGIWMESALPADEGEIAGGERAILSVRFHPSGATLADTLIVRRPGETLDIQIDRWNGRVTRVAR